MCIRLAYTALSKTNLVAGEEGCLQMLRQGQADHLVTEGLYVGIWEWGQGVWAHSFSVLLKELPPNKTGSKATD